MVLENVDKNWTNRNVQSFQSITSLHVQSFWTAYEQSPVVISDVATNLLTRPYVRLQNESGQLIPPVLLAYNQRITYRLIRPWPPELGSEAEELLFVLPFTIDPSPYTVTLTNATNNTFPIRLAGVRVGQAPTPQPTSPPTIQEENDQTIVIVTVVITVVSLLVAGGYIIYITRQEDEGESLMIGPSASESYDEDEFFRASGLPIPVDTVGGLRPATTPLTDSTAVLYPGYAARFGTATTAMTQSSYNRPSTAGGGERGDREGTSSLAGSSVSQHSRAASEGYLQQQQSRPTYIQVEPTHRRGDDVAGSAISMPLSVISDIPTDGLTPIASVPQEPFQQHQQQQGTQAAVPAPLQMPLLEEGERKEEIAGPSPLEIPGFQMEVEELDDFDDEDDDDEE